MIDLSKLKPNKDNPREITKQEFERLKRSLKRFPTGLKGNPIVVDEKNVILSGNQRYKALLELGYTEIKDEWVLKVKGWSKSKKTAFIIKSNQHSGSWDFDKLFENFNDIELKDYGIEIPGPAIDYSILETETGIDQEISRSQHNIMKAVYIEVEEEDYEEIYKAMNELRLKDFYTGKEFVKHLKQKQNGDHKVKRKKAQV